MRPPILPDRVRLYVYAVAFVAWAIVQGGLAYFAALDLDAPDVLVGAAGVVEWLVGAGLLTAATHTTHQALAPTPPLATLDHADDE